MSYGPSFHDNQPIWYVKRVPVYATTVLTAVFVAGLILCVILESAGLAGVLIALGFTTPTFLYGALWQPLTYVWLGQVNFFTPLGILCFYCWAVEVEKYVGRSRFYTLFGTLVLTPVLLGVILHAFGFPSGIFGSYALVAAFLIAFATLYPNIEYFGWIPLKWFAFACVAIGSLMYFPRHDWMGLMQLWASCAVAFGFIRWLQHGAELPRIRLPSFKRRAKLRVLPNPIPRDEQVDEEEDESMSEVDVLLDKIAKSGIGSLTSKERQRLEKAREELMKRETPRR
jgi:Family of unknown function (DUF6576)